MNVARHARKHTRRGSWRWLALLVLITLTACDVDVDVTPTSVSTGTSTSTSRPTATREATQAASTLETAEVIRVVDGDTLVVEVDGREERLRYIGIDTPESVAQNQPVECFGVEASRENARLVEGRTIELEKDISERDRFGRLLRYVYVTDPETGERLFVNWELVARGYASVSTFPPDVLYEESFRAAEREAREEGRGLWGAC